MGRTYRVSRERLERTRARELAREMKAKEKESALDAARLAVEAHEARLRELTSLHCQCSDSVNWHDVAAQLPPPAPRSLSAKVRAAERADLLLPPLGGPLSDMARATASDRRAFEAAMEAHRTEVAEVLSSRELAMAVLSGDSSAYLRALSESPSLSELTEQGGVLNYDGCREDVVECWYVPQGTRAIPTEIHTLTSTGKLSTRPMPRAQYTELYQDHICSGVLRIGREVHALLPVKAVLVSVRIFTGDGPAIPVISVVITRIGLARLDFLALDPSDAVESFDCRSNFKATRRSESFLPIEPFSIEEAIALAHGRHSAGLVDEAGRLLSEFEYGRG